MAQFHQYDPLQIEMSWNGIIFTGFAEGTFILVERDEDSFTKQVGAGGDVVRVKSNNRGAQVTLTLLQSSPVNDMLSGRLKLDERTTALSQVGPMFISDRLGGTKIVAASAWIKKPANASFAQTAETREWMFDCASLDMIVGGHAA